MQDPFGQGPRARPLRAECGLISLLLTSSGPKHAALRFGQGLGPPLGVAARMQQTAANRLRWLRRLDPASPYPARPRC